MNFLNILSVKILVHAQNLKYLNHTGDYEYKMVNFIGNQLKSTQLNQLQRVSHIWKS